MQSTYIMIHQSMSTPPARTTQGILTRFSQPTQQTLTCFCRVIFWCDINGMGIRGALWQWSKWVGREELLTVLGLSEPSGSVWYLGIHIDRCITKRGALWGDIFQSQSVCKAEPFSSISYAIYLEFKGVTTVTLSSSVTLTNNLSITQFHCYFRTII